MVESRDRKAPGSSETTTWPTAERPSPWYWRTMESWTWVRTASSAASWRRLVGLDGGEVAVEVGELELGVVVALQAMLGLVVEAVDRAWTSSMSGSAWAGPGTGRRQQPSRRADRAVMSRFRPFNTSGRSPLRVVRLPGELTGSGTTCPTPAPRHTAVTALQGIHPRGVVPRLLTTKGPRTRRGARADPVDPLLRAPERPTLVGSRLANQVPAGEAGVFRPTLLIAARQSHTSLTRHAVYADSTSGAATGCTSRSGGTRPPSASTSSARRSSSSNASSGGGPSSTVTTQSWQASPRTTQVSQSILSSCQSRSQRAPTTRPGGEVDRRVEP